jgi:hypothetical protein
VPPARTANRCACPGRLGQEDAPGRRWRWPNRRGVTGNDQPMRFEQAGKNAGKKIEDTMRRHGEL